MTKTRKTEIACIICNNAINFPEYIGQDYGGDLLCGTCGSLLRMKLNKWEVNQYRVLKNRSKEWKGVEKLRQLRKNGARLLAKPEKNKNAGRE